MRQLTFELVTPARRTFANFLPAGNEEAFAAAQRAAARDLPEGAVLLHGPPACGRTHLLEAAAAAAREDGHAAEVVRAPDWPAGRTALEACALLAVDDVDRLGEAAQARMFGVFNARRERGLPMLFSAGGPPAGLPLREDLRTRLSWGLVYRLYPLPDEVKPAALVALARERGFHLAPEVIAYLLSRTRRDMATLIESLAALDRLSLERRRPVTVALLREWLQPEP